MQIGGLGGSHSTSDHHVTNCIHDHHDVQKDTGMFQMKASAAAEASAAKSELQQDAQFSLSAWLKNTLGNGKGLLLNFWEGGQAVTGSTEGSSAAINGAEGNQAAAAQTLAQANNSGITPAAAEAVPPAMREAIDNNTSYHSAGAGKRKQKRALWQRARTYFQNMSGRSDRKRSQGFFGVQTKKSSGQVKQLREKEQRRHDRYRRDTVEISAARTEDNFLMDSYDRKGEYSRLTTKK